MRVSPISKKDNGKTTWEIGTVSPRNANPKKYKKHLEDWCNSLSAGKVSDVLKNTPSDIYIEASFIISIYDTDHNDYLSADEVQRMKDLGPDKLRAEVNKRQAESMRESDYKKHPSHRDRDEYNKFKKNYRWYKKHFPDRADKVPIRYIRDLNEDNKKFILAFHEQNKTASSKKKGKTFKA